MTHIPAPFQAATPQTTPWTTPHRSMLLLGIVLSVLLSACAGPRVRHMRQDIAFEKMSEPAAPLPDTQILFYPAAGQTPEQQSRDRYECYQWAVNQTGFDPSQLSLAPHQRIDVVSAEPAGHDTVTGAITGAVIGAIASGPRHAGGGAIVGAIAGGVLGAASDADRQRQVRQIQRRYDDRDARAQASVEEQARNYRRAMTACIEGRGYTVK